ncbi:spermine/spermidine synthase [Ophiocordyceps sinensis CO18]|uniref:Spermine/spermidine synthase n=1 Tax=Ophiocordyceps sinensis (strain Co18 / CGMCC 3.14243) TaxID=911162 RepID=T5A985_OPHSC|nr:spermine/spermidine synthase [Ophiocordyceps sinensis CO18]
MGRAVVYTRLSLELALGVLYAASSPSKLLAYAVPPLLHTLSMMSDGWLLLDRRESVTGYVSVLQSLQDGFRVMRCDHSLLGGDWIDKRQAKLPEPIYGVFVMLEAVRLAETESPVPDEDAHALVVGLGVGTTPSALVTHGINTTTVEIDPAVYDYAVKYFDLRENNPPVLEDAVGYTSALAATAPETFDYIVHDVFTGGAEPVPLFTLEFLQGLATLLKPNGVVAINYAGDLALPAPGIVFRTIKHVFPTCRVFREVPRDEVAFSRGGVDFTNMVIFCTKTSAPLTFRMPTRADHFQSAIRQEFMRLQHEIPQAELLSAGDAGILRNNDTSALVAWHDQSALGHWAIMRTVLPAWVWERW